MAEPHVVTALVAKRAELAGELQAAELQAAERRIDQLRADLGHVDAVLRLFDPEFRPESIAPKRRVARDPYFAHGERSRLILHTLRSAGEPLSTRAVTLSVMATKGLDTSTGKAVELVEKGIWRCLQRHAGELVERVPGRGRDVAWRINGPAE